MDAVEIQPDSAGVVVVVAPGAAWASSAGDVVHSGVPSEESTLGPAGVGMRGRERRISFGFSQFFLSLFFFGQCKTVDGGHEAEIPRMALMIPSSRGAGGEARETKPW